MFNSFVGYSNMIPLLAPQDIAGTATASSYMDVKYANKAAFLISIGALTTATAADHVDVTVEAASAPTAAEAAVSFSYRLSGALGTNTWGAVTAATSTGFAIASTDDNKLVWIELDLGATYFDIDEMHYLRVVLTPDGMTATLVGIIGVLESRYRQTTHLSATGAASA